MDLSFNQISYDGELSDFDRDDLIELVREFEKAQESNIAEFEKAAETLEGVDEASIEEFEEADAELTQEVTEETFLSEEEAEALSFERKREVLAEHAGDDDDGGDDDGDGDGDDEDFGKRGATHGDGDGDFSESVEESLSNITGVVVSDE